MNRLRVRALVVTALLALVVLTSASPAFAAQVRRAWHASITGSAAGAAVLVLYPNSTGSLTVTMRGLQPSTVYSQMIYKGTCATPTALVKLPGLKTTSTGSGTRTMPLSASNGAAVWSVGPTGTVAFRISSGAWTRCAPLRYEVATRVAISRYGIDLPVVHQPGRQYPYCNVAMYMAALSQPGEAGPTMIYAHARTGMFLPLLTASKVNNGKAMIGTTVKVWTSDNKLHTYQVIKVMRHLDITQLQSRDFALERLWLQTSEGPRGTRNKLIVIAKRISTASATYAQAHPKPRIVICH